MTTNLSNTARKQAEADRRAKANAALRDSEKSGRRRGILVRTGVAAGVTAVVGGLITLGALTGTQSLPTAASATVSAPGDAATVAGKAGTGLPPWPNAADPKAATLAAGITPAHAEGAAEHYHAHLDVIVDGKPVPVAAGIGIDPATQLMSPLHVHDGDGLVHIESPTAGTPFYLGQVFREWDVALSDHQLGGLHTDAGHTLTAYVNGRAVTGNPASIKLTAHQEIALVYGDPPAKVTVPSTYAFGND
jgi:hypothetical protein